MKKTRRERTLKSLQLQLALLQNTDRTMMVQTSHGLVTVAQQIEEIKKLIDNIKTKI